MTVERRTLLGAFAAAQLAAFPRGSLAHSWPQRPVRIIVPFSAGGPTDVLARIVARTMAEDLGQGFVVENRIGAGGNIGTAEVARAEPDGHTLLVSAPGSFSINQFTYDRMPYVPERDLTGVVLLAQVPIVLVVNAALPVNSVAEFIAYAKARPGQLNGASGGVGTSGHLSLELFRSLAGLDIVHVPYGGSTGARTDLLAGRAHLVVDNLPVYLPDIRAGRLRVLATGTPQRTRFLPDLPTLAEAGVPGYASMAWYAMAAPAATPRDLVRAINRSANTALRSPENAARIDALGAEILGGTSEETNAFFAAEAVKWRRVVEVSGAKARSQ